MFSGELICTKRALPPVEWNARVIQMQIESVDEGVEAIFTNAQMLLDHGFFISGGRSAQIFNEIEAAQTGFVKLLFHT